MKRLFILFSMLIIIGTLSACIQTTVEPGDDVVETPVESEIEAFLKEYFNGAESAISVTENITLPTSYNGTTVIWFSPNQDVINSTGTIHRPLYGEDAVEVTLSFTMYGDTNTYSGNVTFLVLPEEEPIENWGYYEGAQSLTGESLKSFLHELIDDHDELTYGELWEALADTDEDPNNSNNVLLLYSEVSISKDSICSVTCPSTTSWNREHVWPKSHGGFDTSDIEGTDLHHIRPSLVVVNSGRGNLDFDDGGSLQDYTTDSFKDGDSFEPADSVKGDVARMIFYMAVRYEGDSGELDLELNNLVNNSGPYVGKLSVLLEWHLNDLPDAFEIERNNRIYEKQGNRNPFIDHPEFVELIWTS
ncbi:endonuclease [Candidatus Xianfuyuplasma coldseepsis]|uniref:Ribonuclease n=1 Tax=Candidatus Xianfuyuplasma coldseepsis TaxID=2782163 RepID=A0A7L7KP69_9MOLU|nr:endonuclease [Xianfuyuplasma coldseepsis]QMS84209.1 ribonuclease [Xianfuyuplasma coldseepsis]